MAVQPRPLPRASHKRSFCRLATDQLVQLLSPKRKFGMSALDSGGFISSQDFCTIRLDRRRMRDCGNLSAMVTVLVTSLVVV